MNEKKIRNDNDSIEVVCYGESKVWKDRVKAYKFYERAAANSEGSERERYINICLGIIARNAVCRDEM